MIDKYLKFAPLSFFAAYFIKSMIFSVGYAEAVILAVLELTTCYFHSKNNEEYIKLVENKILETNKVLENKVTESIKSFEAKVNEVESIKAQINSLKINSL